MSLDNAGNARKHCRIPNKADKICIQLVLAFVRLHFEGNMENMQFCKLAALKAILGSGVGWCASAHTHLNVVVEKPDTLCRKFVIRIFDGNETERIRNARNVSEYRVRLKTDSRRHFFLILFRCWFLSGSSLCVTNTHHRFWLC